MEDVNEGILLGEERLEDLAVGVVLEGGSVGVLLEDEEGLGLGSRLEDLVLMGVEGRCQAEDASKSQSLEVGIETCMRSMGHLRRGCPSQSQRWQRRGSC